jgi:hypothetical protein
MKRSESDPEVRNTLTQRQKTVLRNRMVVGEDDTETTAASRVTTRESTIDNSYDEGAAKKS